MRPLKLLVTLLWLVTMALFAERHFAHDSVAAAAGDLSAEIFKEQWMGIYQEGRKVGWSSTKLSTLEALEGGTSPALSGGYKVTETAHMKLAVMGVEKTIDMSLDALIRRDFRLESFSLDMKSDVNIKISGTVEGRTLKVVLASEGLRTQYKLKLKDEPYLSPALSPFFKSGIRIGEKIRLPMLEPSSLAQGNAELEVVGKDKVGMKEAYKVKGSFNGAEFMMWVTPEGELLKEESAGLTFIREDENTAKEFNSASFDIITGMAVPFNMELPEDVGYLKVRISGIDTAGLELDGGNQTLKGDILEISESRASRTLLNGSLPLTSDELKEYLSSTLFIQSNDPEIISKSKAIVGGAKEPIEKTRLIYKWVYEKIEKAPTVTIPAATEVLKSRRGDCNEHTMLFTALARAAGVPARIAVGLVYKDRHFYYHAWPEVYVGGWLPVDPTLGQWPADAAHIRLLTGDLDKQFRLANVIGKLKIEGLEYR